MTEARPRSDSSSSGVAKGFVALGLGEAVSRLLAFGAMVFAARTLGVDLYGTIGFAVAVVLYLNRIADGGFELGLGVREVAADPEFIRRAAPAALVARTLLAVALAAIACVVGLALLPEPDGAVLAVQSLTLLGVGIGARWIHLGSHRAGLAAVAATVGQCVMAVIVLGLVRGPEHVALVPAAQVAGDLVVAAIFMVALWRQVGPIRISLDFAPLWPLAARARHLVASALLGIAIYSTGLVVLRLSRGTTDAGYFTAAYTLVTFFLNVGAMYNLSLLPTLTRLAAEPARQRALFQDAVIHVLAVGLPLAVGGAMLAGPVVGLVYGTKFAAASIAFGLLVWSIPLNLLRDVPLMALMAAGEERLVFRVTVAGAVVSVGLGLALVPRFGLAGAGAATLIAEGVRMAAAFGLAARRGYRLPALSRSMRLAASCGAMAGVVWFAGPAGLLVGVAAGVAVYGGSLFALGGIAWQGGTKLQIRL